METKKKILIVDEESNYIAGLQKELNKIGCEVIYKDDEKKALELAEKIKPDLIISEVNLSGIAGHEFFKEIKAMPATKNVPFVFVSSQKRVDERIKSMEIGVDDFITKPFYVDEVVARIENLLHEVAYLEDYNAQNSKGFSGNLAEMNLVDLIQTLEVGKKSGIIKLNYNAYQGKVFVQKGEIVDARFENLPPHEALMKMFIWTEGDFFVEITDFNQQKTITRENKELISEGLKRINRWEELKRNLPPLNTVVAVNQLAVDENNITDNEKKILKLINDRKAVYEIILKSPFDDIESIEIVDNLYKKGYLRETEDSYPVLKENYLNRIKKNKKNNNKLPFIISNLLKNSEDIKKEIKVERRRDERRQIPDRRRFDRRRSHRVWENKVYLDKTELLLIREKLA